MESFSKMFILFIITEQVREISKKHETNEEANVHRKNGKKETSRKFR